MTRGQETLVIDLASGGREAGEASLDLSVLDLIVLTPTEAELAAHAQQIAAIDKASNGACVWRRLEAATPL
jgi:DNA polymerase-3 subunit epsilon